LLWLWIVSAVTQFGVYSAQPFTPLFIQRELGVHDPHQISLWVGLSGSAIGVSLIVSSPFWGRIADRFGRKSMAVRATGLGGLFVAALAFVQTPMQLVVVRFLSGSVTGNQAAMAALVGSETPNSEVGRAYGLIGSSVAVGRSIGPLLGGLLVVRIGLRYQFALAGLLMCAAVVPLIFRVRETSRRNEPHRKLSLRQLVTLVPRDNLRMAALLVMVQGAANIVNFTSAQFLGVKIIESASGSAGFYTGLTFTAAGICTAAGALAYSFVASRFGYRAVAAATTVLLGAGVAAIAIETQPSLIVLAAAGTGLAFGACIPALNSMIGLESPEPLRATIFGIGTALFGVLLATVPTLAGLLASATDVSRMLLVISVGAVAGGSALLLFGREPIPLGDPVAQA